MKLAFGTITYGILFVTAANATVFDGTYTGNVHVNNNSIIESNSIFNGGTVSINNNQTLDVKDNVQFINNNNAYAIHMSDASFLKLTGNDIWISKNKNGIYLSDSGNVTINGNNTVFSQTGTAIYAYGNNYYGEYAVNITIDGNDTLFDSNTSRAIYFSAGRRSKYDLTINGTGTVFTNNTNNAEAGALYNSGGDVNFNQSVAFNNNSATNGGAIYNKRYIDPYYSTYNKSGQLKIGSGSLFIGNQATNGSGGAIYNNDSYLLIGSQTIFRGNSASKVGGALYNTGKDAVIDINTGDTFVNFETASDTIYNAGGTINFLGTGNINAEKTSLTSVQSCTNCTPVINLGKTSSKFNVVKLQDNTTLKTTVWRDGDNIRVGNISANTFDIQNDDRINLLVAVDGRNTVSADGDELVILIDSNGSQSAGWDLFGSESDRPTFAVQNNLLYNIEFVSDGVYKITRRPQVSPDPIEGDVTDTNDTPTGDNTIEDVYEYNHKNVETAYNVGSFTVGSIANNISEKLHTLAQFEETLPEYDAAISALTPDAVDIIGSVIAKNTNSNLRYLTARMYDDRAGFWINGTYSALDNNIDGDLGYSGSSFGVMFGQDIKLGWLKIGQAFSYSNATVKNDIREFTLENNFDFSLYGQFNLPISSWDFFANLILNHGSYNISENKTVLGYDIDSDFDATETSVQSSLGVKYNIAGFDVGFRNTTIDRGAYTDSIGQRIGGMDTNTSYITANVRFGDTYGFFNWNMHLGGDFVVAGDDTYKNIATAENGHNFYIKQKPNNDSVLTFGANVDFALGSNLTLGLAYDGLAGGDYSEHSGKLRFNWAW